MAAARAQLASEPNHAGALQDAYEALRTLGRRPEALDALSRLVEARPDDFVHRRTYAEELFRDGSYVLALPQLRSAVAAAPEDSHAWRMLAAAQQALGQLADARATWTRVLELHPGDATARAQRGEVCLALSDWPAALEDLQQALKSVAATQRQSPASDSTRLKASELRLRLARALTQLGQIEEARGQLRAVLEEQPRHVSALSGLAELALLDYRTDPAGHPDARAEALALCRQALAIDPNSAAARAVLERVQQAP